MSALFPTAAELASKTPGAVGGLLAVAAEWRARARRFMDEAEQTRRPADIVQLTAMASTLEWAAADLTGIARSSYMASLLRPEASGDVG